MPVILPPETHDRWLPREAGKEVLRPFPVKERRFGVSRRTRHNRFYAVSRFTPTSKVDGLRLLISNRPIAEARYQHEDSAGHQR